MKSFTVRAPVFGSFGRGLSLPSTLHLIPLKWPLAATIASASAAGEAKTFVASFCLPRIESSLRHRGNKGRRLLSRGILSKREEYYELVC